MFFSLKFLHAIFISDGEIVAIRKRDGLPAKAQSGNEIEMKVNKLFLAAFLCALSAGSFAQGFPPGEGQGGPGGFGGRQGGRGPGGNGLDALVFRKDVQADLALTEEQKSKLSELRSSMRPGGGPGGPGGPGGGGEPGGPPPGGGGFGGPPPGENGGFADMQKKMEEARKKNREAIKKILTADQLKRLKGILVQVAGNGAITDADVQADLSVTDAQKAKIKSLLQKQGEANRSIFERAREGEIERDEVQNLMKKNQEILNDEFGKLLTDEQKTKLKAMEGKPFKASEQPRGGG